jgi:hypothetical protein
MFESGSRVTREPLYLCLTVAVVCLSAHYFLLPSRRRWLGLVLGLIGGCYWLTREEGIWLLPMLAVIALPWLHGVVGNLRAGRTALLKDAARCLLLPVLAFLLVVMVVNSINFAVYGVFRNNDLRSGPFPEAYGALTRIRHGEWQRYVVFPKESRLWAYNASPAARELAPYLDGDAGRAWIETSRAHPKPWGCAKDPANCNNEIPSWLFVWALRDAVSVAGHYRSAADADAYYTRLADEINAACDSQAIPCRSGARPWRQFGGGTTCGIPWQ